FPHDVQGAAPDELTIGVGRDAKLLDALIEDDGVLAEEDALLDERLDDLADLRHIAGARAAHGESHASILWPTRARCFRVAPFRSASVLTAETPPRKSGNRVL